MGFTLFEATADAACFQMHTLIIEMAMMSNAHLPFSGLGEGNLSFSGGDAQRRRPKLDLGSAFAFEG